jgi:acetoacetate decarboxylase
MGGKLMAQNRWVKDVPKRSAGGAAGGMMPALPSIEAVYLTDPEALAAVLPPPLQPPKEPRVHARFTEIKLEFGTHKFYEKLAFFAVDAMYKGELGEYPLSIPIDLEASVAISRERYGEPKKLAKLDFVREGNHVEARVIRHGVAYMEITGDVVEKLPTPKPYKAVQWWFKFMPAVSGDGFDGAPLLVRVQQTREPQLLERIEGKLELRELATDPVVDLPIKQLVSLTWTLRKSTVEPKVVASVEDTAAFERYANGRYEMTQ